MMVAILARPLSSPEPPGCALRQRSGGAQREDEKRGYRHARPKRVSRAGYSRRPLGNSAAPVLRYALLDKERASMSGMNSSLKGQRALVTGANSGIGAGVARAL